MEIKRYQTCRIDNARAGLYLHYCETHGILFDAEHHDDYVDIKIYGLQDDVMRFEKWIMKTLYNQEAQRG